MYVSMSRLRVAADQSDALIAAFRRRAHLVEGAEGFVDLQVWRSDRDPEEVVMVSRWEDRAAFTAYMRSAEHRISHDRIEPALQAKRTIEHTPKARQYHRALPERGLCVRRPRLRRAPSKFGRSGRRTAREAWDR